MTPLKRLLGISVLVVSLFGVALADGGETQGVPAAVPPPPECTENCSIAASSTSTAIQPAQESSVDIVSTAKMFAAWLATSIL